MAKIAFIQNIFYEYLGVMYLSAVLKNAGHTVEIFIVTYDEEKALADISAFRPDIAGFSCTTGAHEWAVAFGGSIKQSIECRVVFGGPHPTYFPEIINEPSVDIVCRGEGEAALLELADKIDQGLPLTDTLNCWIKHPDGIVRNEQRQLENDPDRLPFPDRDLYIAKYPMLNFSQKVFMGGRGCPFECTFCFNHAFKKLYQGKGNIVRYRSVANLIAEIKEVIARFPVKSIYFQDDTFILNKQWLLQFSETYKNEINKPFICLIRADLADEEIIAKLSQAGCKTVFFGIECGSERLRNILLKKKITDEQIIKTAKLLKKYGIKFRTYNILGLPGETLNEAMTTVRLNTEIGTNYPWCSLYYPFPGTKLAELASEQGMLDFAQAVSQPSFFKNSILNLERKNELVNLQKLFFYAVKFPKLLPIIEKIIPFRPNFLFDLAFLLSYAWCYLRSELKSIREVINIGRMNVRTFFFSPAKK